MSSFETLLHFRISCTNHRPRTSFFLLSDTGILYNFSFCSLPGISAFYYTSIIHTLYVFVNTRYVCLHFVYKRAGFYTISYIILVTLATLTAPVLFLGDCAPAKGETRRSPTAYGGGALLLPSARQARLLLLGQCPVETLIRATLFYCYGVDTRGGLLMLQMG